MTAYRQVTTWYPFEKDLIKVETYIDHPDGLPELVDQVVMPAAIRPTDIYIERVNHGIEKAKRIETNRSNLQ